MAENKTRPTQESVSKFIAAVPNAVRRDDAAAVLELMRRVSHVEPQMWGPSIIGFGTERYRHASGREGDMPRIGFSPRKTSLVLYVMSGDRAAPLLRQLGKHKTGVSCLYINRLSDVDMDVLETLIRTSWERTDSTPC